MHIQEVTLNTASIPRTKLFYSRTLELEIVNESADAVTFRAGNGLLTFRLTAAGEKPYYHIAFNITNNKFSECFEWINNKVDILTTHLGLPIAIYPDWNAESFYFLR